MIFSLHSRLVGVTHRKAFVSVCLVVLISMIKPWGLLTNQLRTMVTQNHNFYVIVTGSGLAGLTTSVKLLEGVLSVVLVEKAGRTGGNSIKASSGINGVPTKFQKKEDGDSLEHFYSDTIRSGKDMCND